MRGGRYDYLTHQRLPSTEKQLEALKKKGINIGRARTKSTIYYLYNFYITKKNPKSAPRYLAYRTSKHFEQRIETAKEPEKITVRSGTGRRIRYKTIAKQERVRIDKETQDTLLPNMSVTLNRHLSWSKKMLDVLHIDIRMTFSDSTFQKDMKKITQFVQENVTPAIDRILYIRKKYYTQGEHLVGVKVNWKTSDAMRTTDDTGMEVMVNEFHSTVVYQPTHYESSYREEKLLEAIERGALKVFDYHNLEVTLQNIEVAFITRHYMNKVEALRA